MAPVNLIELITDRMRDQLGSVTLTERMLPYHMANDPNIVMVPEYEHGDMKFKPALLIRDSGKQWTVINPNMEDHIVVFRSLARAIAYLLRAEK